MAIETLILQPDGAAGNDAYLYSVQPTTNFGTSTFLVVGFTGLAQPYRFIIQFDISSIPAENTILTAVMELTVDQAAVAAEPAFLAKLTQPAWTEAGATWNTYDGANAWTTAGGDFGPPTDNGFLSTGAQGTVVPLDVLNIAADAHANESGIMRMLFQRTFEASAILARNRFYSSDHPVAADRPKLTVTHTDEWYNQDFPGRYGYWANVQTG